MGTYIIYKNPRPNLVVESTGGRSLGRCYTESTFRITATQPINRKAILALGEAGVLGYGQEFGFSFRNAEGKEEPVPESVAWPFVGVPTGYDEVPGVEVDEWTYEPTGREVTPPRFTQIGYYVYEVVRRCDSSD